MNASLVCRSGLGAALLAALLASSAAAQFDQLTWSFSSPSGTGSGLVTNDQMIIVGPDTGFSACSGSTNAFTAVAPYGLLVVADCDVVNYDKGGTDYDYLVTILDGVETQVFGLCYECQLVLEVPAGSSFGFGVHSIDCIAGPAVATLTHLILQPTPKALVASGSESASQFGTALAAMGDIDGDGVRDVAVGAPNALGAKGRVTLHAGSSLSVLWVLTGTAFGDRFGSALATIGDLDGDGLRDLLVGAPYADAGGLDSGAASIWSATTGLKLATLYGSAAGDHYGTAVAAAGDVDGDGIVDLLIGAPQHDGPGTDAGQAVLLSAPWGLVLHSWSGAEGDALGQALDGVGDIDGDGVPDVVVGSPSADLLAIDSGRAQIFSGATGAELRVLSHPPPCNGGAGAHFGSAVAGLGDVDGDGVPDVVVGAPDDACADLLSGSAWVFSGLDGHLLQHVYGTGVAHHLGAALAGVGDVNGDGLLDVLVGSPSNNASPAQPGRAQLLSGADANLLVALTGSVPADSFGRAVASTGDTDGDGLPDLLVGVPATYTADPGSVRLLPMAFLWTDLGHALAGTLGPPSLHAQGLLSAGTPLTLTLASTAPGLPVTLVVGLAQLAAPFKGGVFVPSPDLLFTGLVSGDPQMALGHLLPAGLPSGTELFFQFWIADAAGPKGLAASNAVRGEVP